jgi:murein biosynthesis integral membrane protein MurJ
MQVKGKFVISSLVPVLFNFLFFVGILYCIVFKVEIYKGVYIISFSVLLSVIAMLLLVYISIIKDKTISNFREKEKSKIDLSLFKLFIPYFIILLVSQLVLYYERYLASIYLSGSVAALNYAYRLSQFPIWVFVAAIGTVLFPMMSKHISKGDVNAANRDFIKALWWIGLLTLPIMIFLFEFRVPIVSILFLRGSFDTSSLKITVDLLSGYTFAILGQSIIALSMKLYLARETMKSPLIIFVVTSSINLILDYFFVKYFGISGLGYAAALSSMINATLMVFMLKLNIKTNLVKVILKSSKLIVANIILAIVFVYGNHIRKNMFLNINMLSEILFLSIIIMVGFTLYLSVLKILKVL